MKDFSDLQNAFSPKTEPIPLPFTGFIQNLGQLIDDTIQYYYVEKNWVVSFAPSTIKFISLSDKGATPSCFSIRFPGSYSVAPEAKNRMNSLNYFYGDVQYTNVPGYAEVWYKELYPGIDLRYYRSAEGLLTRIGSHGNRAAQGKLLRIRPPHTAGLSMAASNLTHAMMHPPEQSGSSRPADLLLRRDVLKA